MIFLYKGSLFNTVSMAKVSISYLLSLSIYQTKCVDNAINFKIYFGSSSQGMADREKEGKVEIQKFEYLENEKSFLEEIKNIFHSF